MMVPLSILALLQYLMVVPLVHSGSSTSTCCSQRSITDNYWECVVGKQLEEDDLEIEMEHMLDEDERSDDNLLKTNYSDQS